MLLAQGAILAAALFTGAAVYITVVEHPARLKAPTEQAVAQWRPSYRRATLMQAPLAVIGALLALGAWLDGGAAAWLLAGLLLGAVVPFTLVVMWPTNKRLEDDALDLSGEEARHLLRDWGRLHAVRSALSLAALLLMLAAS
jgi:hypothetical protein